MRKSKILFGMAHAGFFRNFERVIAGLLEADIDVHIHFSKEHESIHVGDYELPSLKKKGQLSFSTNNQLAIISITAERIRILRDIIHYSQPVFKDATDLRARFTRLQKSRILSENKIVFLQKFISKIPFALKLRLDKVLYYKERKIPAAPEIKQLLDIIQPDYVIVTPLVNFASREIDLIKAAQEKKIPTLLATASWDNLTNKGKIMLAPDHIAVWNEAMAKEAEELHHIPSKKIWKTGAIPFDPWFERTPSRNRKTFCAELKFDPQQPIIVYLCSSQGIAGKNEYNIVYAWRKALSSSGVEKLEKANILIRPHPMAIKGWLDILSVTDNNIGKLWKTKLWPLNIKHPTTEKSCADFFDTLYHADAIVGLNTSAMIEAAILNKPVLTFLGHDVTTSQTGNLHFKHLSDGGFMLTAKNLNEHLVQLNSVLQNTKDVYQKSYEEFIKNFVRPCGQDKSASNILINYIIDDMQERVVNNYKPQLNNT